MIGLSWWYHRNIGKTAGGRALMERQAADPPVARGSLGQVTRQLAEAGDLARDIRSGKYGGRARTMQTRVYWFMGGYLLVVALYFSVLFFADGLGTGAGG